MTVADNTITLQYDGSSLLLNGENLNGLWTTCPQPIAYRDSNITSALSEQLCELDSRFSSLHGINEVRINNLEDEIKSLKKIISNLSTQLYTHLGQHQKQEFEKII